jgi:hypothetical protein
VLFWRENLSIRCILRNREQSLIHPRLLIGLDESPTGYSLARCSPAWLTSASPAKDMMQHALASVNDQKKRLRLRLASRIIRAVTGGWPIFTMNTSTNKTKQALIPANIANPMNDW